MHEPCIAVPDYIAVQYKFEMQLYCRDTCMYSVATKSQVRQRNLEISGHFEIDVRQGPDLGEQYIPKAALGVR